jgi:signal transduction histidine kinase/DNA-binding response OmpR family regulator
MNPQAGSGAVPAHGTGPRLPARLFGLRWKAFAILLALLGGALIVVGLLQYRALTARHEDAVHARLATVDSRFDAAVAASTDALARIASQLGASYRPIADGDPEVALAPELEAALTRVAYYDAAGRLLREDVSPAQAVAFDFSPAVRETLRAHRPQAFISCAGACEIHVTTPLFDHAGQELVVLLSQPATELMLDFRRDSGVDIGLIAVEAARTADWQQSLVALTDSERLAPAVQRYAESHARVPEPGRLVSLHHDEHSYRLMYHQLKLPALAGAVGALFVYDETAERARITGEIWRTTLIILLSLLITSVTLFFLVGAATRTLSRVTRALPLLAARHFDEARMQLDLAVRQRRFPDEADVLAITASWLAERLQKLDEAEAANAAKTRFLAVMSHEIRTPMNGVLGMLELLDRSELRADQQESIRVIRDSANLLLGVLNDILDVSKIEAGRIDLEAIAISVEEIVEGVLEGVGAASRAKPIRLLCDIAPEVPARVIGDPTRLRQILHNLCSNAVKFTEFGRVVVTVRCEQLVDGVATLCFGVQDTGVGIPPDVLPRLFAPFNQAESSTTRRYGGTGLGLSIARGLVERMGGSIGVVSDQGAGSRFWFRIALPVTDARESVGPKVPPETQLRLQLLDPQECDLLARHARAIGAQIIAPGAAWNASGARLILREWTERAGDMPAGRDAAHVLRLERVDGDYFEVSMTRPVGRRQLQRRLAEAAGVQAVAAVSRERNVSRRRLRGRVLVAEDHPTNQTVIRRQLELLGLQVDMAANGAEALELLKTGDYAVLLTDLHMPRLDGYGLARELRRLEHDSLRRGRLPIIAMTADVLGGVASGCREAGMDDFVSKPASLDELEQRLQQWLSAEADGQQSPLETRHLREVIGDDVDAMQALLAQFVEVNSRLIDTIAAEVATAELQSIRERAHRLLGSARTVGAVPLARCAEELEAAARAGDRHLCTETVLRLRSAYRILVAHIEAVVPQLQREAAQIGSCEGGIGRA